MASILDINSNYAGEVAGNIIGASFREADTIKKGLLTILPNVPFQISLRKIEYADGRTNYTCGFAPEGSVTLTEKILTPKKIKNELSICKDDLSQIWSANTMGFSAHADNMPKDVQTALLERILGDTAQATDEDLWQGVAATSGRFGGFLELFAADAAIIKHGNGITALGAAITKANVQTEIEKVLLATPREIRRKSDLVFGISSDVALSYEQALISAGISNGLGGADMELRYGSTKLTEIMGLPDNTIVVFQTKNCMFATGLMSDHNDIRIKDMDESDLSGMVRFKMVYTGGVEYVVSEEIVWYLSTAS